MAEILKEKREGAFHIVINHFGLGPWDESMHIQAGLRLEGNTSAVFYDLGEYPYNRDVYMRHLEFRTLEEPDTASLAASGSALFQFFELEEYSDLHTSADQALPVGEMAVQYASIRRGTTL